MIILLVQAPVIISEIPKLRLCITEPDPQRKLLKNEPLILLFSSISSYEHNEPIPVL
tara:strand:+ start:338 stop:508 length:171 start_codon:yes stop_codon:yes gene_type:complete